MKKNESMVTEEEVGKVWGNANFGDMSRMDVIKYGLLKCAGQWHQGRTATSILLELGLITNAYKLTFRGSRNLYEFFKAERKNV